MADKLKVGHAVWIPADSVAVNYNSIPADISSAVDGGVVRLAWVPATVTSYDESSEEFTCKLEWHDASGSVGRDRVHPRHVKEEVEIAADHYSLDDLRFANQAAVLNAIQMRFNKYALNYTYVSSTLVFLCPMNKHLKIGNNPIVQYVKDLRNRMKTEEQTQHSVVMKGCSGSGKTEVLKTIVQLLLLDESQSGRQLQPFGLPYANLGSSKNPFQQTRDSEELKACSSGLAAALMVLDVMGSCQTDKNSSSSRHVKVVSLHYSRRSMKLRSARLDMSLLDSTRYSTKDTQLKPFHLFPMLVAGLMETRNSEFKFTTNQRDAIFANYSKSFSQMAVEFGHFKAAVLASGVDEETWESALRCLAACVHFQSLVIVGSDAALISSATKSHIAAAEALLGAETFTTNNLVIKKLEDKMGKLVSMDQRPAEAKATIDAVCNEIYQGILQYFLFLINERMAAGGARDDGAVVLSLLDTPGYEVILGVPGGISQLNVNYIEERLLGSFVEHRFAREVKRYADQNIVLADVTYPSAHAVTELLGQPPSSLISLLEDTCAFSRGDDKSFLEKAISTHARSGLIRMAGSKFKMSQFVVKHTFGEVLYDSDGFVQFSKQRLSTQATQYLGALSIPLLKKAMELAGAAVQDEPKYDEIAEGQKFSARPSAMKSKTDRVEKRSLFLTRTKETLEVILGGLDSSLMQHVLCVRPHYDINMHLLDPVYVDEQLRQLAISDLVRLAKSGFTSSYAYSDFYAKFRVVLSHLHPSLPAGIAGKSRGEFLPLVQLLLEEVLSLFSLEDDPEELRHAVAYGLDTLLLKGWFDKALCESRLRVLRRMNAAAVYLQSLARMRRPLLAFRARKAAAVKLQTHVRMRQAARGFALKKRFVNKVKARFLSFVAYRRFQRQKWAVGVIKKNFCGEMILRIRYLRLQRLSRAFQGISRGFIVRSRVNRILKFVLVMQHFARGFLRRNKVFYRALSASLTMQRYVRGYLGREQNHHSVNALAKMRRQRLYLKAILRIQCNFKTWLFRVRRKLVTAAAVVLQRWFKGRNDRKRFLWIKFMARFCQNHCRRLLAVRKMHVVRAGVMLASESVSISSFADAELRVLGGSPLVVGSGGLHETIKTAGQDKFTRCLVGYEANFDLSDAYAFGWAPTIAAFSQSLTARKLELRQVALGAYHTILVDSSSNVYSFGMGDCGQLGHCNRRSRAAPELLDAMEKLLQKEAAYQQSLAASRKILKTVSVTDVCCGRDHTLLLCGSGRMFSWGSNRKGQLGHSNFESSAVPRLIDCAAVKAVKQISCGSYHSACVTAGEKVFAWGIFDCLGSGITASAPGGGGGLDSCTPAAVPFFKDKRVSFVVSGDLHVTVISGRDLYSWGNNSSGQLGCGDLTDRFYPVKVKLPAVTLLDFRHKHTLSCGGRHTLFALVDEVWTWGNNKHGQCGCRDGDSVATPHSVAFAHGGVRFAATSWRSSVVVSRAGVIYVWGQQSLLPFMAQCQEERVTKSKILYEPTALSVPERTFGPICGVTSICSSGINNISMLALDTVSAHGGGPAVRAPLAEGSREEKQGGPSPSKVVAARGGASSPLKKSESTFISEDKYYVSKSSRVLQGGEIGAARQIDSQEFKRRVRGMGNIIRIGKAHPSAAPRAELRAVGASPDGKKEEQRKHRYYDRSREGVVSEEGIFAILSPQTTVKQQTLFSQKDGDSYYRLLRGAGVRSGVGMPQSDRLLLSRHKHSGMLKKTSSLRDRSSVNKAQLNSFTAKKASGGGGIRDEISELVQRGTAELESLIGDNAGIEGDIDKVVPSLLRDIGRSQDKVVQLAERPKSAMGGISSLAAMTSAKSIGRRWSFRSNFESSETYESNDDMPLADVNDLAALIAGLHDDAAAAQADIARSR